MINQKEIKIGNWFMHKAEWSYRQPPDAHLATEFPFDEFEFQWDEHDWYALGESTLSIESIEPILLTPEWLSKFGFRYNMVEGIASLSEEERKEGNTYYWDKKVERNNQCDGFTFSIVKWGDDGELTFSHHWLRVRLKYVHQLQNLFFSLTGKEL